MGKLLDNAFDASQYGDKEAMVNLSMTDVGNNLVFENEDSGEGVPVEQSEQIFERDYSTKQPDRGQGLYLVKKALADLKGEITLGESELGGALFSVFIPKRVRE